MSAGERSAGRSEAARAGGGGPGRPVRVAFFSPQTIEYKAAGLWCELPADRGGDFGIDGSAFPAPLPRLVETIRRLWTRARLPGRIAWAIYWYLVVLPVRVVELTGVWRFDVVFVNLSMFKVSSRPILERIARFLVRRPIVLHMSDAYWVRFRRRRIEERCRLADLIVTGNEYTAAFVRSAGGTVRKVEYGLDTTLYPVREHSGDRELVIGLTGTGHETIPSGAAEGIARACEASGSRFVWVGGAARPDIPALDHFMEWRAWNDQDPHGFFREFDLAVCPLVDDEWTRGKETFKMKEYMAAGLPQVLSPVGYGLEVIENGVEGFFATSSDEWFERLMLLIGEPELRSAMGAAARRKIETRYATDQMLAGIAAVCREAYETGRS